MPGSGRLDRKPCSCDRLGDRWGAYCARSGESCAGRRAHAQRLCIDAGESSLSDLDSQSSARRQVRCTVDGALRACREHVKTWSGETHTFAPACRWNAQHLAVATVSNCDHCVSQGRNMELSTTLSGCLTKILAPKKAKKRTELVIPAENGVTSSHASSCRGVKACRLVDYRTRSMAA